MGFVIEIICLFHNLHVYWTGKYFQLNETHFEYFCQIGPRVAAVLAERLDAARVRQTLVLGYLPVDVLELPPDVVHLVVQVFQLLLVHLVELVERLWRGGSPLRRG